MTPDLWMLLASLVLVWINAAASAVRDHFTARRRADR